MSALAHYIEDEGLPTVVISLIREHSEQTMPPRALWVPFELGRPLGLPDDAAFQRRVCSAALELLAAESGPVHVDFPDEAPEPADFTGWACPISLAPAPPPDAAGDDLGTAFIGELARLRPWYDLACETRGRTTVGASGLDIDVAGGFLADALATRAPALPRADLDLAQTIKLVSEDIKAYYSEAATAKPGPSTSTAIADWFWTETAADGSSSPSSKP